MRATERNLSHDEADKIELICKNIGQQNDYDWTKDMKKLSPGAKFILYEEVGARFPRYLSSNTVCLIISCPPVKTYAVKWLKEK